MPSNLFVYDQPNQRWRRRGNASIPIENEETETSPARYTETNAPWSLKAGESLLDGMPAGVTVVNASSYSSSRELRTVLTAVDTAATGPVYVQLEADTYTMSRFYQYSDNSYRGWANSQKNVLGIIGRGVEQTRILVPKTAISDTPDLVERTITSSKTSNKTGTMLYWSDTGAAAPLFISGISFDGDLQEPFTTYGPGGEDAGLRRNQSAPTPLAWDGMTMWGALPGSVFQFCRFRGFAFALTSAPPFEKGCVNSNRSSMIIRRIEIDGRVAADLRPSRPRASGGWMWNKESDVQFIDSWQHHTRRSGMATNTNTRNTAEKYYFDNFQCEAIADVGDDGWASDIGTLPGGFSSWNVEGVIGTFEIRNSWTNPTSQTNIINWAVPKASDGVDYPAPDHAVIKVFNYKTSNPQTTGGLLRISTPKQPNSTGISPIWQAINDDWTGKTNLFFDVRNSSNVRMSPVRLSQYNASIHKPNTHFILNSF